MQCIGRVALRHFPGLCKTRNVVSGLNTIDCHRVISLQVDVLVWSK